MFRYFKQKIKNKLYTESVPENVSQNDHTNST